jgi:glutaredoxin
MEAMLAYSKGQRQVPVIVDGDQVTIGYGGS